ncbi:MAG: nucleotidyltransferase [Candidatus Competibacteraceae bacterium]|nr:nucleotidyltransferase [Candidatus Competibacteraceae bacterium]
MTAHKKIARTHDDVLEEIAAALDIPPSKFEEAKERYEALGAWLDSPESTLSAYDPTITPQGSFLLGTVTRPLTEAEEYDVDLVCLLKASKTDFTQKSLKETVGVEIRAYARAHDMEKKPEEGRRCWTLHYADDAQFHMDVLPALPDAQRYRVILEQHGHRDLARNSSFTGQAIAITDNTLPQYDRLTDDWPQSNPMGYAAWFRSRMAVQLTEQKKATAQRQLVTASVDDIPDHQVRTPLQRAIQLLKRHRDCMFADDDEHKPISIIITTLAAHAYDNEPTIAGALQTILKNMDRYIEYPSGEAWIANPVNPAENFADKWAEEPKKRENFLQWLARARTDFALYLRANRFDQMPDVLKENLGIDLVDQILSAVIPAAVAAPAIVKAASNTNDVLRAEAAVDEIRRTGTQSKPWAKS